MPFPTVSAQALNSSATVSRKLETRDSRAKLAAFPRVGTIAVGGESCLPGGLRSHSGTLTTNVKRKHTGRIGGRYTQVTVLLLLPRIFLTEGQNGIRHKTGLIASSSPVHTVSHTHTYTHAGFVLKT